MHLGPSSLPVLSAAYENSEEHLLVWRQVEKVETTTYRKTVRNMRKLQSMPGTVITILGSKEFAMDPSASLMVSDYRELQQQAPFTVNVQGIAQEAAGIVHLRRTDAALKKFKLIDARGLVQRMAYGTNAADPSIEDGSFVCLFFCKARTGRMTARRACCGCTRTHGS